MTESLVKTEIPGGPIRDALTPYVGRDSRMGRHLCLQQSTMVVTALPFNFLFPSVKEFLAASCFSCLHAACLVCTYGIAVLSPCPNTAMHYIILFQSTPHHMYDGGHPRL